MPAAAIPAAASVAGALIQSDAAKSAANAQAGAARDANALQWNMYQQQRADQEPWRKAGGESMGVMGYLLGLPGYENFLTKDAGASASAIGSFGDLSKKFSMQNFQADPGYAFQLQAGQDALNRANAASGKLGSGSALKGALRFSQGLANQTYNDAFSRFQAERTNQFNRLASIAGMGQTSANALGGAAQNYGNFAGNMLDRIGTSNAAAGVMGANAWNNAFNQLGNLWMQYQAQPTGITAFQNAGTGAGNAIGSAMTSYLNGRS